MTIAVFLASLLCASQALLFDDPCDIVPTYDHAGIPDDPDYTTTVHVQHGCRNGTFRWDYPKGHVIVHFFNQHHTSVSVCIRDFINGDVFTFVDKTVGAGDQHLGSYTDKTWACTTANTERDIVLEVDAPDDMYYMGQVEYKLMTSTKRR